jgi:spore coat polysaccharide biosynthesis protein SpsF
MAKEILCIIQARVGSIRLPGKVLLPLGGKAVLERIIERIKDSKKIDKIIVATSVQAEDDKISDLCQKINIDCFRGSENDVLDRYYQAAKDSGFSNVVRITGDCPLIDPEIIDQVVELFQREKLDYATNVIPPTFPDGLDVEIFSFESLVRARQETKMKSEREHVTIYMWQNSELFKQKHLNSSVDLSGKRWTLDNPEDYEFIKKIFDNLYLVKPKFRMNDVLKFLETNPELEKINQSIKRNEGLEKSLKEDEVI